jgi:murein DD-endopeptidase MepM/ murein hydrolase activator NlpD
MGCYFRPPCEDMIRLLRSLLTPIKLKSWYWLGLGFLCLSLIWGAATPSSGAQSAQLAQATGSIEELQRQQQQIDQQRSQVTQERDRLKNLERATQGNLQGLQRTITATASQIQDGQTRLQAATQQLKALEASLIKSDQSFQQRQVSTVARLRFLQRQQVDQGWAVLLQSHNINEFLDRRHQLRRVYRADQQRLQSLRLEANRLEQQRNQVEQKKNEIALLTQQLQAQKADSEIEAESQKALIARLKSDRRALEAAEAQLTQDSQNVTALIQQKMATRSGILLRGTGQMVYPCAASITSSFGWRTHPILGYEKFHSGVDFGADYGALIAAADRGTVIFAGWYGGYGNAVIIDHGSGITTLYGHASELYVTEGQSVQRGQAIAAVGSTGFSTGPHLHFEVRREGTPTDPMAFL